MWTSLLMRTCVGTLQVNLNKPCPFWSVSSQCGLRDCAVKPCSPVSSSSRLSAVNKPPLFTSDWRKLCLLAERGARGCANVLPQQGESIRVGSQQKNTGWLESISPRGVFEGKKFSFKSPNIHFWVHYKTFWDNSEEGIRNLWIKGQYENRGLEKIMGYIFKNDIKAL